MADTVRRAAHSVLCRRMSDGLYASTQMTLDCSDESLLQICYRDAFRNRTSLEIFDNRGYHVCRLVIREQSGYSGRDSCDEWLCGSAFRDTFVSELLRLGLPNTTNFEPEHEFLDGYLITLCIKDTAGEKPERRWVLPDIADRRIPRIERYIRCSLFSQNCLAWIARKCLPNVPGPTGPMRVAWFQCDNCGSAYLRSTPITKRTIRYLALCFPFSRNIFF